MSEAEEMARLLGFAAFGGGSTARNRSSAQQRVRVQQQRTRSHRKSVLAQIVPGTELHALFDVADSAVSERIERGTHGVTFLVHDQRDAGARTRSLAALLRVGVSSSRTDPIVRLLPPRSYELLDELQDLKNRFDAVDSAAFYRARSAANPFERIGRGRFLNRSAMKLVNMDHIFDWTATAVTHKQTPFMFADVCGGPGGFSEYLLWRIPQRGASVCGFGITLQDATCDWRLPSHESVSIASAPTPIDQPSASFDVSYGADGTGDLYQLANIRHFSDRIRAANACGVDLVVADGGFQDARDQCDQEQRMTRLVVAETLTMLRVLKPHGTFVVKTFEVTSAAMLQLVWLLHQCFARLTVVKPVTSRPASSERYVVAQDRLDDVPVNEIVAALEARVTDPTLSSSTSDLVDTALVQADRGFIAFMSAVSDGLAHAQIDACRRILERVESGTSAAVGKRKHKRSDRDDNVDTTAYTTCWYLDDDDNDDDDKRSSDVT